MSFATLQRDFAAALAEPGRPVPRGVVAPGRRPDAARFAVYRNNVHVGLIGALAKIFPVTHMLVGADFFTGMAREFVRVEKPCTPLLMDYGAGFPDFVENFAPAAVLPYLPDVARVEVAWLRAYHAADVAALSMSDLSVLEAGDIADMVLPVHPALGLIRSAHAVGSIWAAHQARPIGRVTATGSEAVLVTRPLFDVIVTVVPAPDAAFVQAIIGGGTLGTAAAAGLAAGSGFDFGRALLGLVSLGAFAAGANRGEQRP